MNRTTLLIIMLAFLSCNNISDQEQKVFASPAGYDLKQPVRYRVRESMQEISGIEAFPDETNMIAVNDEEGKVYQIDVHTTKAYPTWKFAKHGDFEDICRTDSGWFVLKSNGSLYEVHGLFADSVSGTHHKFPKPGKREFETTYFDSLRNAIILISKNAADDKKAGVTSAFRFDLATRSFDTVPVFQLNNQEIAKLAGTDMRFFKPSAAAIHPVEKRLYIVASVNGLLVITDLQGHVQEAYNLKHRLFRQPEGLTFAANGDLYISNEGGDDGSANILKFTYHRK